MGGEDKNAPNILKEEGTMFDITPQDRKQSQSGFSPFKELENLEKSFFGRNSLAEFKTDIQDIGEAFVLEADLPGFKKENISIDIDDHYLTIKAERLMESSAKDSRGQYISRERSFGSFARSFNVSAVDTERITAEYQDGVLKLALPKKNPSASSGRRLEIH